MIKDHFGAFDSKAADKKSLLRKEILTFLSQNFEDLWKSLIMTFEPKIILTKRKY